MRQLIARELRRAHRRIQPAKCRWSSPPPARRLRSPKPLQPPARSETRRTAPNRQAARNRCTLATAGMAPTTAVRKLAAKLAKMTLPEREAVPGIGPRRAEIIVAGAQVYAELLESFGLTGFRYSPLGLRDGILAQMLAEQDARAKAHREFEHERWESVLATARRYGVDPRQAEPVRAHARAAFSRIENSARAAARVRELARAAAILRDTGKFINHQGHHRHTQYIISSSEIYGYTQLQRTLVSAIARYLGKSRPQPGDRALRNIPADEHKNVQRAVVLLRLAVALNQDRASDVLRVGGQGLSQAGLPGVATGAHRRGTGVMVAAQRGGLLPRGLRARAFRHAGIDRSAPCADR